MYVKYYASWASGVSHPGRAFEQFKVGTKWCKSVSNIFIVSCMPRFDNSDTHLDCPTSPPSGAGRTSAPLASRENDIQYSVSCQDSGVRLIFFFVFVFLYQTPMFGWCLIRWGIWGSMNKGMWLCHERLCSKMTFWMFAIMCREKKLRSPRGPTWMMCLFVPPLDLCPTIMCIW